MAKGKVHMLTGSVQVGDGPVEARVHCNQRHRKLLPLLSTTDWSAVTCSRCLTHRPKPETLWSKFLAWLDSKFMARRG